MVRRILPTRRLSTPETRKVFINARKSSDFDNPPSEFESQKSNHRPIVSWLRTGGSPSFSARRSSPRFSTIHCNIPPSAQKASVLIPPALLPSRCHSRHQQLADPVDVVVFSLASASCNGFSKAATPEHDVERRPSPSGLHPNARRKRSASTGNTASKAFTASTCSKRPSPSTSTIANHCQGLFSTSGSALALHEPTPSAARARHKGQPKSKRCAHK
mmetsp:Transcript_120175/g.340197  ORF Transcript_120175/g.340197 Transcript_120175/m.340197 type:complete len:217 (+) Transcript_120175:461-1111(+)